MVYLLNSPYSENQPDSWLCGGVLISTTNVLTAAACLTEVSHMYVIAGYKKYVSGNNIQDDVCTRTKKQKIVKIIIPKAYNSTTWIKFDIGIAVVEKPYNFFDMSYRTICSYEPEAISINYDINMEAPNTSVLALGWGGSRAREPGVIGDINSEYLMSAYTIITNKSLCRRQFSKSVDFYFLCTTGLSDSAGVEADASSASKNKCDPGQMIWNGSFPLECLDSDEVTISRKSNSNSSIYEMDDKNRTLNENKVDTNYTASRKQGGEKKYGGICQNDHGGPLVALSGQKEIVIGVALNSVYNDKYQCKGPFLYLSTARSSVLIKCLLSSINETRKVCESMNYEVKEYNVPWPDINNKIPKGCENGGCRAVRIRPQMRLLDLVDDVIEE